MALGLAVRHGLWPRPTVSRQAAALLAGGLVTAALAVGLASGLPDRLSNAWDEFKDPERHRFRARALLQRWRIGPLSALAGLLDAFSSEPLTGIGRAPTSTGGPATDLPTFVRDAHNLYLETLGSSGFPAWRCSWRRSAASSWSGSAS